MIPLPGDPDGSTRQALAKAMLARFGSFPDAIAVAEAASGPENQGMSGAAIVEFKIVEGPRRPQRFARGASGRTRLPMGSWSEVIGTIAAPRWRSRTRKNFRVLFLDKKNGLIRRRGARLGRWIIRRSIPRSVRPSPSNRVHGDSCSFTIINPRSLRPQRGRSSDAGYHGDRQAARRHRCTPHHRGATALRR